MFHARWPVVCAPSRTVSIYAPNIPGQCREGSPSLKSSVQSHIFCPSLHHPSDFVPGFVLSSNSTRRFSILDCLLICRVGSPSLKSSVRSHIFRPSLHHQSDFVPGSIVSSNSTRGWSSTPSGFLSLIADHHHSTVCVQILSAHTLWSISVVKSVIVIVSPSQVHLPAFMPAAS